MIELLPFFIVLFAGLFFSELFARFHLPWVVTLVLGGIIIGPFGLDIFATNQTIDFLSQIGLVFLMFMAGLETRISNIKNLKREISVFTLLNAGLPFLVGLSIGLLFGYTLITALIIGIVFTSSSVAVIIPSLQSSGLVQSRVGRSIIAATVVEDIVSLILLSIVLQTVEPITRLPLPLFYLLLFGTLVALRWIITKARTLFIFVGQKTTDLFQQELRSIFVILIGTVIAFELLGLHPVVAGFFAGLVLSEHITSEVLKEKLRAISYGLFIPIFFVVVGSKTNLAVFTDAGSAVMLTGALLIGSMLTKFLSGMLAGKLTGFTHRQSALIGAATIPQLSTTLAVAFAGFELGVLNEELITAIVVLSIVTVLVGPLLTAIIGRQNKQRLLQRT